MERKDIIVDPKILAVPAILLGVGITTLGGYYGLSSPHTEVRAAPVATDPKGSLVTNSSYLDSLLEQAALSQTSGKDWLIYPGDGYYFYYPKAWRPLNEGVFEIGGLSGGAKLWLTVREGWFQGSLREYAQSQFMPAKVKEFSLDQKNALGISYTLGGNKVVRIIVEDSATRFPYHRRFYDVTEFTDESTAQTNLSDIASTLFSFKIDLSQLGER